MRVLVVDDEKHYRDYLSAALMDEGHEVNTAANGRSAIQTGIRFQPHVLITDWMLRNHLHGIHVSDVLRAVDPRVQTILMTGYPSSDLAGDIEDAEIARFIQKPFNLSEIMEAVAEVAETSPEPGSRASFAVVECDPSGEILRTNVKAQELFSAAGTTASARRLEDIFVPDALSRLEEALQDWVTVSPLTAAASAPTWWARCKRWPESMTLVLIPTGLEMLKRNPCVGILLDISDAQENSWPFSEHVLVVDDDKQIRDVYVDLLRATNSVCYRAESEELAINLIRADPKIGIVITDYEMTGIDVKSLIKNLRKIRRDVKIVGNSASDRQPEFAALGVDRYLDKPWRMKDLFAVLCDAGAAT